MVWTSRHRLSVWTDRRSSRASSTSPHALVTPPPCGDLLTMTLAVLRGRDPLRHHSSPRRSEIEHCRAIEIRRSAHIDGVCLPEAHAMTVSAWHPIAAPSSLEDMFISNILFEIASAIPSDRRIVRLLIAASPARCATPSLAVDPSGRPVLALPRARRSLNAGPMPRPSLRSLRSPRVGPRNLTSTARSHRCRPRHHRARCT